MPLRFGSWLLLRVIASRRLSIVTIPIVFQYDKDTTNACHFFLDTHIEPFSKFIDLLFFSFVLCGFLFFFLQVSFSSYFFICIIIAVV